MADHSGRDLGVGSTVERAGRGGRRGTCYGRERAWGSCVEPWEGAAAAVVRSWVRWARGRAQREAGRWIGYDDITWVFLVVEILRCKVGSPVYEVHLYVLMKS